MGKGFPTMVLTPATAPAVGANLVMLPPVAAEDQPLTSGLAVALEEATVGSPQLPSLAVSAVGATLVEAPVGGD